MLVATVAYSVLTTSINDPFYEAVRQAPSALVALAGVMLATPYLRSTDEVSEDGQLSVAMEEAVQASHDNVDRAPPAEIDRQESEIDLPLLPRQIEWIAAAGNYVELHGAAGQTRIHRAPLRSVETVLETKGFVRIHRSTLVRADRIEKIESGHVRLASGKRLRVGPRYRAELSKVAA